MLILNSSPVIHLNAGLVGLDLLPGMYGRVVVPTEVLCELESGADRDDAALHVRRVPGIEIRSPSSGISPAHSRPRCLAGRRGCGSRAGTGWREALTILQTWSRYRSSSAGTDGYRQALGPGAGGAGHGRPYLMDFSSWQAVITTLLGLVVVTVLMVGIRLLVMETVQQRRNRENRQINERLRTFARCSTWSPCQRRWRSPSRGRLAPAAEAAARARGTPAVVPPGEEWAWGWVAAWRRMRRVIQGARPSRVPWNTEIKWTSRRSLRAPASTRPIAWSAASSGDSLLIAPLAAETEPSRCPGRSAPALPDEDPLDLLPEFPPHDEHADDEYQVCGREDRDSPALGKQAGQVAIDIQGQYAGERQ